MIKNVNWEKKSPLHQMPKIVGMAIKKARPEEKESITFTYVKQHHHHHHHQQQQ